MKLTVGEIIKATRGKLLAGDLQASAAGVSTDSRKVSPGELFVPLQGPNFDGHDFLAAALMQGASGALVERGRDEGARKFAGPGKFLVVVAEPLKALGDLARFWRSQQPAKIVALTGSSGKTTTKEMIASILATQYRVLKTEGNLNNLIGLPLMLLRLTAGHEVAVLEMGMSGLGEIRRLKEIADPEVSLITNIGHAHLETLGSPEGIARAKGELWEGLRESDWIAVNADDPRVLSLAASARGHQKTFALVRDAEVSGKDLAVDPQRGARFSLYLDGRKETVRLQTFGRHNVYNALAAATVSSILGIGPEGIVGGLEIFRPYPGRGNVRHLPQDIHILDESYNSNPDSLAATLRAFYEMKGKNRGIVVIGDMLELGPGSAEAHEQAGRQTGEMAFGHLFFLGKQAPHLRRGAKEAGVAEDRVHTVSSHEEALEGLKEVLVAGDWVLVKGSRGMHLERVIEGLDHYFSKA
jgi:UDP-N-acetylmuramoyl-tripeptide--D-alanyl-D-alanine ligase